MAKESMDIKKEADVISIWAHLRAHIVKEDKWYVSHCPSLGICSQGKTITEAKKNIIEATELFIESCFERGVLDKVLAKKGFSFTGKKSSTPRQKTVVGAREFRFSAEFPFAVY